MRAWEMLRQLHMVERLWQMSLLACGVIGFVLVLRQLLKRCSRGYSYGLWLLVLLRLLCPVMIESDYSVQPLALTEKSVGDAGQQDFGRHLKGQYAKGQQNQRGEGLWGHGELFSGTKSGYGMGWQGQTGDGNIDGNVAYGEGIYLNSPVGYDMTDWQDQTGEQTSRIHGGKAVRGIYNLRRADSVPSLWEPGVRWWRPLLRGVYLLGVVVLLAYFTIMYFCWKWRLSVAVRKGDNIWYSEQVSSPFVLGILRPRIYLPYGLDNREEGHILLHEQTHIRHRDPLLRLLGTLVLCLHWWNPMVWLGIHCFYQDMEMFCDEAAMGRAPLFERRAYAETLLHFALRQSGPGMALAFGEPHTEQRVRNILYSKRRGRGITLAVALAAMAGGMIFLTVPQGSRAEAETAEEATGQGDIVAGKSGGKNGGTAGEMKGQSDVSEARTEQPEQLEAGETGREQPKQLEAGETGREQPKQLEVAEAGTEQQGQLKVAGNLQGSSNQELNKIQNLVLAKVWISLPGEQSFTLQLIMTEGVHYTREQVPESLFEENYEGSYQLQALDEQGQILSTVDLVNEQGSAVMNFCCRDFPWRITDYNRDGQLDLFLGTKAADGRSYHYLMTVTDQGELSYLYEGPMWEGYWPMEAEDITNVGLESGDDRYDYRVFFLYQMNQEYSSHDFYTWSSDLEQYRKSVVFTEVYPERQDQEALNYLEGSWRISGIDMWNQKWPRPNNRIGEVLHYENGSFQQQNLAGDVVYEHVLVGSSSLAQSKEEFWNTYNLLFSGNDKEMVKRILVNIGTSEDGCEFGNVIYVVSENVMLVYDLKDAGTFWTATREELRGEDREVQEYLQGIWEVTGIASRPYDALEQEEAEAFVGTKLTYDWQNTANEYTIEGVWNYSIPIQGFGQKRDNSANRLPKAGLPTGEVLWYHVNLGEGEFLGNDLIRMDENRVWLYYMGTFFEAERRK